MRTLPFLFVASTLIPSLGFAADKVTVGQWNGMLIVTAPTDTGISRLGARAEQKITLDARDQPITETAAFIRQTTKLNVIVAPALIANPPSLTLQVKDMTLAHLLSWVAENTKTHIAYINDALYISDKPIEGSTSTRLYDVRDLGATIQDFPGPNITIPTGGAAGGILTPPVAEENNRPKYDLDQLEELINRFVNLKQPGK
ncbi:MAG: hypothetical protein AAB263_15450 [Planctomycetota bacterium]